MKSTFRVFFYLKKDKLKRNGKTPIFCRITVDSKATRFSMKLEIDPALWNIDEGKSIGKSKEAKEINLILDNTFTSLHKIYREILEKDNYVTAEKIKNAYLGLDSDATTILQLFRQHNDDLAKLVGISIAKATLQKYEVSYRKLEDFMKFKYNISDINLKEVDHRFITDFDFYMKTKSKCSVNTTYKYMKFFKKIILIAKNNGWISKDPFANYKIRFEKVDRGYLTDKEISSMMRKEFASKRLENVRDIFVFSCYTGLAYIDIKNLRQEDIQLGFDNKVWIMTKREKTNINVNVPLLEIPRKILAKYKDVLDGNKILPIMSNQKMNEYLKEIADLCGIDKSLSFHLARHTFATTVTLSKGVPIESVSKMLGHTNVQTTQIYARIINEKISYDMANLARKLKKKS